MNSFLKSNTMKIRFKIAFVCFLQKSSFDGIKKLCLLSFLNSLFGSILLLVCTLLRDESGIRTGYP